MWRLKVAHPALNLNLHEEQMMTCVSAATRGRIHSLKICPCHLLYGALEIQGQNSVQSFRIAQGDFVLVFFSPANMK